MTIQELEIAGAFLIHPPRFDDPRGWFRVNFSQKALAEHGIPGGFVQSNTSHSLSENTIRGLHMQLPPFSQAKFVQVLSGQITDILVDARPDQPTFRQHCKINMSAAAGECVYVPRGVLHGFITRKPNTIVNYLVDNDYSPESERTIKWDDPSLGIDWKLTGEPVLSPKDQTADLFDAVIAAIV